MATAQQPTIRIAQDEHAVARRTAQGVEHEGRHDDVGSAVVVHVGNGGVTIQGRVQMSVHRHLEPRGAVLAVQDVKLVGVEID